MSNFNIKIKKEDIKDTITLPNYLTEIVNRVHKYLTAWNDYLWDMYKAGLLPVYNAGFIDLDKQYVTVGVNGFLEAAEFLGIKTKPNCKEYKQFAEDVLTTIKNLNTNHRGPHIKFNTELTPCESAAAHLYEWDKKAGYKVPENRNLYNSYFYPVEDPTYDIITKMYLQGKDFTGCLDGGSAYHANCDSHLSQKQYRHLMDVAIKAGCSYFTFNIPNTICNDCGHIDKRKLDECPNCHGRNLDFLSRIIGYLKRISNFPEARQIEAKKRYYAPKDKIGEDK